MRARIPVLVAATAAWVLACPSCGPRHKVAPRAVPGAVVGTYRVQITEAGDTRRFRMLLFAALPDRVHAEMMPPVGGPELVVDGGGGRLAVSFVRDRIAYVGEATPVALERVLGLDISLEAFVRALLLGEVGLPDRLRVRRLPEREPGLPETFELREDGRTLRIDRRGTQHVDSLAPETGTGRPPTGMEERPLTEIPRGLSSVLRDPEDEHGK